MSGSLGYSPMMFTAFEEHETRFAQELSRRVPAKICAALSRCPGTSTFSTRAGFAMCWAPSNTNAHSVSGDFAHKHQFMKASCSRHATEQHTSQTRTIRASAFYPFNVY